MKLHVLTAVTRPRNLPRLTTSLRKAIGELDISLNWHWRFDPEHRHIGGQIPKNEMLDEIADGWVYVLDDDTLCHPKLLLALWNTPADASALVVTQSRPGEAPLTARKENMRVGHCDIGQAIIRRDVIGSQRIPDLHYGDGLFLSAVLEKRLDVHYLDEPLSLYNALR